MYAEQPGADDFDEESSFNGYLDIADGGEGEVAEVEA